MRKINKIVVHCTASSENTSVQNILSHFAALGWHNPGYHYLVDCNGDITQLLPEDLIANGAKGHNRDSIHVAYIGGLKNGKPCDTRTQPQKDTMLSLITQLSAKYPSAKVMGHRDLSPDTNNDNHITPNEWLKQCPCFDVRQWLHASSL